MPGLRLGKHRPAPAAHREAGRAGARLIVWPESAVPYLYDTTQRLPTMLRDPVRHRRMSLFFGNDDRERLPEGAASSSGRSCLDPKGALTLRYHKMRLVPFGEYVPLRPLAVLRRPAGRGEPSGVRLHPGDGGRCRARGRPRASAASSATRRSSRRWCAGSRPRGAELLVNITNDAWYGRRSAPHQHLAMAAFAGGREPALPGARRQHRHHGDGRPAGRVLAHDAPLPTNGSSGRSRSSRRRPSTRGTATSSPGPARGRWPPCRRPSRRGRRGRFRPPS